ncbi:MAG: aldehyde dehydrogenase family protein [Maricaulaceae bacterium]|jgi:aldehyde dehydrogenase (NAD+)
MRDYTKFYINGEWVDPVTPKTGDVINPATEEPAGKISLGSTADVDKAMAAARAAFPAWSTTSREERIAYLEKIIEAFKARSDDLTKAVSEEMGSPVWFAQRAQVGAGLAHFMTALETLKSYEFEHVRNGTLIRYEPIGVCALITPWNWPLNQVTTKVAPALAVGCTVVVKPAQLSPFSAHLLAEIIDEAGLPAGVYNSIDGQGSVIGAAMASHAQADLVSFTGSTSAGASVAMAAAPTIKRVCQELGGKSPNIILEDADLEKAIPASVGGVMANSGQSCNAPTRLIVPNSKMSEILTLAKDAAEKTTVGDPNEKVSMGPVVSQGQWDIIQGYIQKGLDEGAELVAGGLGRPDGLNKGYYVKPTVFAGVTNDMTIAQEEIFGPVLVIIGYDTVDQAVEIANDTVYGLSGYIWGGDLANAQNVARKIRAGQININGARPDFMAPFGGYKQSGNGREWGDHAFTEYLETKAVMGYEPAA